MVVVTTKRFCAYCNKPFSSLKPDPIRGVPSCSGCVWEISVHLAAVRDDAPEPVMGVALSPDGLIHVGTIIKLGSGPDNSGEFAVETAQGLRYRGVLSECSILGDKFEPQYGKDVKFILRRTQADVKVISIGDLDSPTQHNTTGEILAGTISAWNPSTGRGQVKTVPGRKFEFDIRYCDVLDNGYMDLYYGRPMRFMIDNLDRVVALGNVSEIDVARMTAQPNPPRVSVRSRTSGRGSEEHIS